MSFFMYKYKREVWAIENYNMHILKEQKFHV